LFSSSDGQEPAIQISSTHEIGSPPLSSWNWHPKEGLKALLERLNTHHQLDSILIEGGAFTLQSFLDEDVWDEIKRWKNPSILGNGLASPTLPEELTQPPFGPNTGFAGDDEWQQCIHPRFSIDHLRL
jgi:riboflavin biosynthesis pyrimidine reductase